MERITNMTIEEAVGNAVQTAYEFYNGTGDCEPVMLRGKEQEDYEPETLQSTQTDEIATR